MVTHGSRQQGDRAETLISQGKQLLKQAALDFGMQFARSLRQEIENLTKQLQESLMQGDEVNINQHSIELEAKLDELNQQMLEMSSTSF